MKKTRSKLIEAIESRGLNVNRVADMAHVPQSSLYAQLIRDDKTKLPRGLTMDVIVPVAKLLGLSLDYLVDDAADAPPASLDPAQSWAIDFIAVKKLSREEVIDRLTSDPRAPSIRPHAPRNGGETGRGAGFPG
jgi:hypothetical protein